MNKYELKYMFEQETLKVENLIDVVGKNAHHIQDYAENLLNKKNCFRLLEGKKPLKKISIPYAISVLITEQLMFKRVLETQDNGRNIWEQTAKQLLRTYNSKRGLKLDEKK